MLCGLRRPSNSKQSHSASLCGVFRRVRHFLRPTRHHRFHKFLHTDNRGSCFGLPSQKIRIPAHLRCSARLFDGRPRGAGNSSVRFFGRLLGNCDFFLYYGDRRRHFGSCDKSAYRSHTIRQQRKRNEPSAQLLLLGTRRRCSRFHGVHLAFRHPKLAVSSAFLDDSADFKQLFVS